MIAASISIFVMALLFVAAGLLRLGAGHGCGSGHCHSCTTDCELESERRLP